MYQNVKYELQELERLISSGWQKADIDNAAQNILGDTINNEVERIKQTFIHEVFSFQDERHLERYIQYHQQALIRLMDKIVGQESVGNTTVKKDKNISQYYYNALEELLSFVERHFAKYFDQDAKAPETYLAIARNDASINLKKLQRGFTKRNADGHIVEIMLYVLRKIINDLPHQGTTYRKVIYAKEVQKELFRLLKNNHHDHKGTDEELRLIMYYLNYNWIGCFTYHTHYINSILEQAETRAEKIEKLSFLLKTINQAQVKPGVGYNLQAPPIRSQLNSYIEEEIDHIVRLQQLANIPASHSVESLLHSFKIHFELSVAQMAYLVKIFVESKIIVTSNVTGLLRFLAKLLMTKRSESISYDSFRSKFYNVEASTKEAVKNMLLKMVECIGKN